MPLSDPFSIVQIAIYFTEMLINCVSILKKLKKEAKDNALNWVVSVVSMHFLKNKLQMITILVTKTLLFFQNVKLQELQPQIRI